MLKRADTIITKLLYGGFFGFILYGLISTQPDAPITQALTYFTVIFGFVYTAMQILFKISERQINKQIAERYGK